MFLNILRISASNGLKVILNIIVSIEYWTAVIFRSYKPTESSNTL